MFSCIWPEVTRHFITLSLFYRASRAVAVVHGEVGPHRLSHQREFLFAGLCLALYFDSVFFPEINVFYITAAVKAERNVGPGERSKGEPAERRGEERRGSLLRWPLKIPDRNVNVGAHAETPAGRETDKEREMTREVEKSIYTSNYKYTHREERESEKEREGGIKTEREREREREKGETTQRQRERRGKRDRERESLGFAVCQ